MSNIVIKEIKFEEIIPIWKNLWPARKTKIRPASSMTLSGAYNLAIYEKYQVTFWGAFSGDRLVGVNSGHKTNDDIYRSRGLYVDVAYRRRGVASLLLAKTISQAKKEDTNIIWSIPREEVLKVYLTNGFMVCKNKEKLLNTEYGPNIYVSKKLGDYCE